LELIDLHAATIFQWMKKDLHKSIVDVSRERDVFGLHRSSIYLNLAPTENGIIDRTRDWERKECKCIKYRY